MSEGQGRSKIPEFEPPQASVSRIIKSVLPNNVMLTKDARAAFTRAAGIFIFYITHAANEFSKDAKRSTIYPQDIKDALKELEFEDFEAPLAEFLENFKAAASQDAAVAKAKKAANAPKPDEPDEEQVDVSKEGDENVEQEEEKMTLDEE